MSRIIALIALAIVAVCISSDRTTQAAVPTTQPIPSAENAKMKELVHVCELQKAVLCAQLQALAIAQQAASTQPYRAVPQTNVSPYLPDPNATLGHFQYNGKTVYLVGPIIAKPITYRAVHPEKPQSVEPELIQR